MGLSHCRAPERRFDVLAFLVTAAGFAVRLDGLTFQSFWRDEVDALRFAAGSAVTSLAQPGWNGPLYTFALARWLAATGQSEWGLRYSSVLAGALAVPLVVWLGRKLLGSRAGIAAGALAAFSPYLVWYSQELKMYALLCLLGLASFAALLRALQRGEVWRWGVYAALTGVIPYVHILGALLIPAQVAGAGIAWRRRQARLRPFLLTLALLVLPYVPLAIWQARLLASAFQTGHPYYPLTTVLSSLARVWTSGVIANPAWWQVAPFGLALLAVALTSRRSGAALPLLAAWVLAPPVLVWLISLRTPVFADRYLIASLPGFLLLVAAGVEGLLQRWRPLGLGLLAFLLMLGALGITRQGQHVLKADARGASALVREGWQDGDALVLQISYLSHSMDYYLGPGYPYVEGPYTNPGMSPEEVDLYLRSRLVGKQRVWLLLSEAEMWDARGLTAAWFAQNARLLGEWHLARVDLYLYELPW